MIDVELGVRMTIQLMDIRTELVAGVIWGSLLESVRVTRWWRDSSHRWHNLDKTWNTIGYLGHAKQNIIKGTQGKGKESKVTNHAYAIAYVDDRFLWAFSQNLPTAPLWKQGYFQCEGINLSVLSVPLRVWVILELRNEEMLTFFPPRFVGTFCGHI